MASRHKVAGSLSIDSFRNFSEWFRWTVDVSAADLELIGLFGCSSSLPFAAEMAPSIIFMDEIDAVGTKRYDASSSGEKEIRLFLIVSAKFVPFNKSDPRFLFWVGFPLIFLSLEPSGFAAFFILLQFFSITRDPGPWGCVAVGRTFGFLQRSLRGIQRTMLELLNQLDGFDAMDDVKVSRGAEIGELLAHLLLLFLSH